MTRSHKTTNTNQERCTISSSNTSRTSSHANNNNTNTTLGGCHSFATRLVQQDSTITCIDFGHGNPDVALWTRFRFQSAGGGGGGRSGNTVPQAKQQIATITAALASNSVVHTLRIRASFLTHLDLQTPSAFLDSLHVPTLRELQIDGDNRTVSFNVFALARMIRRHAATLKRLVLRHFAVTPNEDARLVADEWKGALLQTRHLKHLEIQGVLFPRFLLQNDTIDLFWSSLPSTLETLHVNGTWQSSLRQNVGNNDTTDLARVRRRRHHLSNRRPAPSSSPSPFLGFLSRAANQLHTLVLHDWLFPPWEWDALWQAVAQSGCSLKTLDLSHSSLYMLQWPAVGQALRTNTCLTRLICRQMSGSRDASFLMILFHLVEVFKHGNNQQLAHVDFSMAAEVLQYYVNDAEQAEADRLLREIRVYTGWNRSGFVRQLPAETREIWASLLAQAATRPMLYNVLCRNAQSLFQQT